MESGDAQVRSQGAAGEWLSDERFREGAFYAAVVLVTCLVTFWALELWRADLRVLWINGGDARAVGMGVKSMIQNGWFLVIPQVGAPGTLITADFPSFDLFHNLAVKVISLITGDYAVTVNTYYLLGYPLVALSAAFVLRRLHVSRWSAFMASVLFAFLPYHYLRGDAHLFLSAYFVVPLSVLLAIRLDSAEPPLFARDGSDAAAFSWRGRASAGYLLIALLAGFSGLYYAYFTCFLLLVGGVYAASRRGSSRPLASAGVLIGVVVAAVLVQMTPTWVLGSSSGQVVLRDAAEADGFGLRLSQLLLPLQTHRFPAITSAFGWYWKQMASISQFTAAKVETSFAALGIVAAAGFVVLIAWLAMGWLGRGDRQTRTARMLDEMSVLNAFAVLLATTGGLGAIVALALPQVRAYNRMSVVIAFLALLAVALLLDLLAERLPRSGAARLVVPLVAVALLIVGVLDQTSPALLPPYEQLATQQRADTALVAQMESRLSPGSAVLQLPLIEYPESPEGYQMRDYQHFRGPLSGTTLRWSYGAPRGQAADRWLKQVTSRPVPQMIAAIQSEGFRAIWIDRAGYEDRGAQAIAAIASATGSRPIEDANGTVAVFVLR